MSDRPWHRSLIKTGARLILGGARAHYQDAFPWLTISRASEVGAGDVRYRGKQVAVLSSARVLQQRAGESIFVVGSGPSIARNDLGGVPDASCILLNGAIGLWGGPIRTPLAIAVEDERFIWRHFDLLQRNVKGDMPCLFSVEVLRAICEIDPKFLSGRTIILIDDIRKPYAERRRRPEAIKAFDFVRRDPQGKAGISLQPDRGLFRGGSVAVSALQFALYCHPKLIGFFGIDISNADQPRFYETKAATAASGVAAAESRIVAHFLIAKTVADERGITMANYSPVSALVGAGFGYDDRFAARSPA